MKFWIGVTDIDWFDYLSERQPDEVNFWQPHPRQPYIMEPGTPFLFKLKSPINRIAGGGFFVRFSNYPCSLAWQAFGEKNGVRNISDLIDRMSRIRRESIRQTNEIGCNILAEPFFLNKDDWIKAPGDFSPNIVVGKAYDTDISPGKEVWSSIVNRLINKDYRTSSLIEFEHPRYGQDYLNRARLGQGAFRMLVTDAYHRRCAITNEKTLPALEAAHIKDYSQSGPHRTNNGLLLRADIHRLFDDGYVTIDFDLRFLVSRRVKEQFENGKEYYRFHGHKLQNLPESLSDLPSEEFIKWHNEERFESVYKD